MARYLVTGGAGFIGSQLANQLVGDGHEVIVLDDLSSGNGQGLCHEVRLEVGSVLDTALVASLVELVDGCFHLAGKFAARYGSAENLEAHQTNLIGSINLLKAASKAGVPVVYGSSSTVYGDNAEVRLKESARPRPITSIGADKLSIEHHASIVSLQARIPITGLRFFNVYGSRVTSPGPRMGVVESFVDSLLKNEAVRIYGDGQQIRDFVYIKDAVRFLRRAMTSRNPVPAVYNVCTGEAVSINQVARSAMSILNIVRPLVHEPARASDIRGFAGDPTLSSRQLGVSANYGIAEGLLDFINETRLLRSDSEYLAFLNQASSQACFLR